MRVLFFDCFSGASGDMVVGALRDAGAEEAVFFDAIKALAHGHGAMRFRRAERQGVSGWKFEVEKPNAVDHEHRSLRDIREMIECSALSLFAKQRSLAVFRRIAVAEGRIHGVDPEAVHFHEVGAWDSITDVVCACAGIEALAPEQILSSPLVDGRGWVDCAHGRMPVPAPATVEILRGISLRQIDVSRELITPTGAALLAEFVSDFGLMPELQIESIGYGIGSFDDPARANVLRVFLGHGVNPAETDCDEIMELQTNLDDLNPELAGAALESLFRAGALDAFFTAVQMKKNRPGVLVTVLSRPQDAAMLGRILLAETGAFGFRMHATQRRKLKRETASIETPFGEVQIKLGYLDGRLLHAAPEYESCRTAADRAKVSVRETFLTAAKLAHARYFGGEEPGDLKAE